MDDIRIHRKCNQCHKPMLVWPAWLKRAKGKFCSDPCAETWGALNAPQLRARTRRVVRMIRFELERWGDGTIRLMHWDSLGGRDIEIKLLPEGATVIRQPINLTSYLCGLIEAQERGEGVAG